MAELIILLIAAHFYGDFLLQTKGVAANKTRWPTLFLHGTIHGGLAYLILQQWTLWQLPVVLILLHILIDRVKASFEPSPEAFALDQLSHLLSILAIALGAVVFGWIPADQPLAWGREWIIAGAGFCAAVLAPGYFIGEIAARIISRNPGLREALSKGLRDGGAQIGRLERALIFMFIFIGHPAGIGFLIAAKSILRFEEAKKQNIAEYILIGTFWSFGLAIALSWLTIQVLPR